MGSADAERASIPTLRPVLAAPDRVPALDLVRAPVDTLLEAFLDERVRELARVDACLERVGSEVADLVRAGGKRLRPAFVYWGYRATGAGHCDAVLTAGAAVELLHTFALIHDDVMDGSLRRRGRPTVHEALAAAHTAEALGGEPRRFGLSGAILAGDLAFVWADQLLDGAGIPAGALQQARRVFTELRIEVMAGQYLDLRLAGLAGASEADSLRVSLLKSGRYTVTRPLQLGAALGGGDSALDAAFRAFGDAVGVAFQLRDDVLGLFGEPEHTGKGALEDLREGKRTMLMLRALRLAAAPERAELTAILGNPCVGEAEAARARRIVADCGALASVERTVTEHQQRGRRALAAVGPPAREALEQLADLALFRVD
ncbi:MAG TPA: polyprenyl synthetase family protein [Egibacteraceae bacterium]|nr:polyprenyl synthetase family protein [Egibacteraceae bacterium]